MCHHRKDPNYLNIFRAAIFYELFLFQVIGLRDCVVYGVEIPGTEGRAGMAAISDPDKRVDLASLYAGMVDKLPSYARPIFLRFVQEIDVTGL